MREHLEEPRAIQVHPYKGWLFYSDWGDHAHIGTYNVLWYWYLFSYRQFEILVCIVLFYIGSSQVQVHFLK